MRKAGITYDLRLDYLNEGYSESETAEFDRPDTIEAIDHALRSLGYETDRIGHVRNLVKRLASGDRWDFVFNICEGMYGIGREAQVPAILDAYNIPYVFSDPLVLSLTLHKGMTKRIIRDCGLPTPDFVVISEKKEISSLNLPFPLFAKPVAEGTGKGIDSRSKIMNPQEAHDVIAYLLDSFHQPVLVETFLPGREFTVGIIGTGADARAIGTMEVIMKPEAEANAYSFVNKENCEELMDYAISSGTEKEQCEAVALAAWRHLNCRDGGRVDLKMDAAGIPNFLEVNPLAGLHPEHSDLPIICNLLGIPFIELIRMMVESALKRTFPSKIKSI